MIHRYNIGDFGPLERFTPDSNSGNPRGSFRVLSSLGPLYVKGINHLVHSSMVEYEPRCKSVSRIPSASMASGKPRSRDCSVFIGRGFARLSPSGVAVGSPKILGLGTQVRASRYRAH